MTYLPRRPTFLDPDHPAVACADPEHWTWLGQFDDIFGKSHEIERLAFYRTAFRRQWMGDQMWFSLSGYLREGAPSPRNVKEWLFLWSGWIGSWRHSQHQDLNDAQLRIKVVGCLVQPMSSEMLEACRDARPDLYQEVSLALWQLISSQVRYEDRFRPHYGAGGIHQAFVNARIRLFDRFLTVWPIETDPALAPILEAVGPWWVAWKQSQNPQPKP